jgi:hypothetical protein
MVLSGAQPPWLFVAFPGFAIAFGGACYLLFFLRCLSRPRNLVDTSLEEMMLLHGGGHGQTQERQEVPCARRSAGRR